MFLVLNEVLAMRGGQFAGKPTIDRLYYLPIGEVLIMSYFLSDTTKGIGRWPSLAFEKDEKSR